MYIAVKGGQAAIAASHQLLEQQRRGPTDIAAMSVAQIEHQLGLLVARVMAEAGVYDRQLAALSIKQACGDAIEAVFLLRAYRTTLPRFGTAAALDTQAMRVQRRVSSIFKDMPGGQVLGPTFDYTQRLLDFDLLDQESAVSAREQLDLTTNSGAAPIGSEPTTPIGSEANVAAPSNPEPSDAAPDALAALIAEGLIEAAHGSPGDPEPDDITVEPPHFPVARTTRMQMMARGDEGWLLGMGYSTQRGYAFTHPFAGEIRVGKAAVSISPPELGFEIGIGEVELTECQMINQFVGSADVAPTFTRGYALVLGHNERKAMAISLLDRAQRHEEFDENMTAPAQDAEFALGHADSVEASGFVQHLKLPHYVTFESELELLRQLRADQSAPETGDE